MDMNSLAHTKWNCKYHIVFAPKYRRKIIYGQLKRDLGNFHFKEGGQNYHSVGEVDEIQVIIQDSGSVKAPEYSHTANRSYAIVQNGKLKHLTFYDETHSQVVSIDLMHQHHGLYLLRHNNHSGDYSIVKIEHEINVEGEHRQEDAIKKIESESITRI